MGVSVLALMMFLTSTDVLLRYVFRRPITGSVELIEYMLAILVAFSIAYCAVRKRHVSIDLVVSHFPQRVRAIVNGINCLMGMGILFLITWQCAVYVKEEFDAGLTSGSLYIPVFPFVGAVALGSAMFFLVLLTHLFEFVSRAVRK